MLMEPDILAAGLLVVARRISRGTFVQLADLVPAGIPFSQSTPTFYNRLSGLAVSVRLPAFAAGVEITMDVAQVAPSASFSGGTEYLKMQGTDLCVKRGHPHFVPDIGRIAKEVESRDAELFSVLSSAFLFVLDCPEADTFNVQATTDRFRVFVTSWDSRQHSHIVSQHIPSRTNTLFDATVNT